MKGRRLLITGAAGFTGRHAVAYFAGTGAEVTAVVRRSGGEAALFPPVSGPMSATWGTAGR